MFRQSCCCVPKGISIDTEELLSALQLARKKSNAMTDKQFDGRFVNRVLIRPISPMFPIPTLGSDKSNDTAVSNAYNKASESTLRKYANDGEAKRSDGHKRQQLRSTKNAITTQPITTQLTNDTNAKEGM